MINSTTRVRFIQNLLTFTFIQLFLIFGMSLSLWRYNQGQLFYYDFGIFAHTIYQLSQFHLPYLDHIELGHVIFLGDHFNPSLSLLAPLFWLVKDIRILVTEQALPLALSGLIIYKIGRQLKLNYLFTFLILVLYLGFPGNLNPFLTDWHPEATANFFLLLFIYLFVFKNNLKLSLIPFFIFLGFKESNALSLISVLIWVFFFKPLLRKKSLVLAIFSFAYFLTITKIVIPHLNHSHYIYVPQLPTDLHQIILNLTLSKKVHFVEQSFKFFFYLPLLSGFALIPIVTEFLIRLLPTHSKFESFTLGMHYNIYLATFMTLASILSLKHIQLFLKKKAKKFYLPSFLIISVVSLSLLAVFHRRARGLSPLNLLINPVFWSDLKNDQWVKDRFTAIPNTTSIMSQNNLLPYLTTKADQLYLFQSNYQKQSPDLIIFDTNPGQNINDFYGSDLKVVKLTVDKLKNDPDYRQLPAGPKDYYLFVRLTTKSLKIKNFKLSTLPTNPEETASRQKLKRYH